MPIIIAPDIEKKLRQPDHNVSNEEIEQCFCNRRGKLLVDPREEHRTNPQTQWFVAETDRRRKIKVIFVRHGKNVHIKSAYEANEEVIRIYRKYAMQP